MVEAPPRLAPPGAGIPFFQKLVLRYYVGRFIAGKEPLEKSRRRFDRLHEKVRAEFLAIPEGRREERVLVPPQRGLEDSSRFWSAAMVLEHLEIVGSGIAEAIVLLANDRDPGIQVNTATVKPHGTRSAAELLASFDAWRTEVLPSIDSRAKNLDAKRTLDHPWFGPFTARKWYWLLGIHAGVHLEQIGAIRARLPV